MSVRRILQAKRAGGSGSDELTLRNPATDVDDFVRVGPLVRDLLETMSAHPICVGLAAPQVGNAERVAVASVGDPEPIVMINPVVLVASGKKDRKRESCMSLWGLMGEVERRDKVTVRYVDRFGAEVERQFKGYPARVVQHEIDHLNGLLYDTHVGDNHLDMTDLFDAESADGDAN